MKTKTKIKLITILIAVLACTLIAGCQVGRETYQQYVDRNNLTCHITYCANGGIFETRQDKKEVYYKPDTYAINIGVDELENSNVEVHRDGYVFKEWCYAYTENGNIVYEDAAKTVVRTDKAFDFTKKLVSGTEVSLYATWVLDVQIEIRLAGANAIAVKDGESTKTVNPGEELLRRTFGRDTQLYISDSSAPVESTDSTFLQYFTDSECKEPFGGVASKPTEENAPNVVIYAKYMPGIYTVVKSSTDALNMFAVMGGTDKYYIYNDIDMDGATVPTIFSTACTVEGNGSVKISNFKITASNISTGSLFGSIYSEASFKDVTFDNFTVSYTVRPGSQTNPRLVSIYGVCSDIADGAKFENAVISNMSVVITAGEYVQITNLYSQEADYRTDNWLFGKDVGSGEAYTDAQFKEAYGGLTVKNSTLTINSQLVATAD